MSNLKIPTRWLLIFFALLLAAPARAATTEPAPIVDRGDPYQMLKQATDQLLQTSKQARSYAKDDPERYYREILSVLDPVLDFDYFARGAMGNYGSTRRYAALKSEKEKAEFRARVARFNTVLKRSLLVTYADALLSFNGDRIELEKPASAQDTKNMALVQRIHADDGKTYTVQYSLRKVGAEWRVFNVIVEGINLGQLYRTQFADAVEQNKGDIDYVVDNWIQIMQKNDPVADKKTTAKASK